MLANDISLGNIDFDVSEVKETLKRLNAKLLVLDFSSPLSPRTNKKIKDMACAVDGQVCKGVQLEKWASNNSHFMPDTLHTYISRIGQQIFMVYTILDEAKQLQKTNNLNSQYVFLKTMSDWFEVENVFFSSVCAKSITSNPQPPR